MQAGALYVVSQGLSEDYVPIDPDLEGEGNRETCKLLPMHHASLDNRFSTNVCEGICNCYLCGKARHIAKECCSSKEARTRVDRSSTAWYQARKCMHGDTQAIVVQA